MIEGKLLSLLPEPGGTHEGTLVPWKQMLSALRSWLNESVHSLSGWWVNLVWMRRGTAWHQAAPRLASWHLPSLT